MIKIFYVSKHTFPSEMHPFIVAIDGPAGAGKTDAGKLVAANLGITHYSSGLTYRGITAILLKNMKIKDFSAACIEEMDIRNDGVNVFYNGADITALLRLPEVDANVSYVAKFPFVREKAKKVLQMAVGTRAFVIEGRDIGTMVIPNAEVKIFLTASCEARARRRVNQIPTLSYEDVLSGIKARDCDDITREHGPLKMADDAILIDNSDLTLEDTVKMIVDIVNKKRSEWGE